MAAQHKPDAGGSNVTPLPTRRRGRGEARREIIEAARVLYAQRGYDNTSMRDVAQLSDTSEALIYRSVGNKEQLFREAVLEPYEEFVSSFVRRWEAEPTPLSNENMMSTFIGQLYGLLSDRRELILALVSANAFSEPRIHPPGGSALNDALNALTGHAEGEAELRGFEDIDVGLGVRCVVGLVMSFVVLDDWLLPQGADAPGRAHLISELTGFALGGLLRGTNPPTPDTRS
jgi:AcrR family transcriptional regulator